MKTETNTAKNFQGSKFNRDLGVVEIAKLVRADLKAAVKAGELPKATYSVRCQQYSGGRSIDISVADVDGLLYLYNQVRLASETAGIYSHGAPDFIYSVEARELLAKVEAILQAYNFDKSDSQSDCFHVHFYGDAKFGSDWSVARRELEVGDIKAELRNVAERADTLPAPAVDAQVDFLAFCGVPSLS